METKTCRACGETKPVEEFYAHPDAAGGRQVRCRACEKVRRAHTAALRRARKEGVPIHKGPENWYS
jgi:hypothetical protein